MVSSRLKQIGDHDLLNAVIKQESNGRWIADLPDIPGCSAYGASWVEAVEEAKIRAHRVLVERWAYGEQGPTLDEINAAFSNGLRELRPPDVPDWTPQYLWEMREDWSRFPNEELSDEGYDLPLLNRLATDSRMKWVWREIAKHDAVHVQQNTESLDPCCSRFPEGDIENRRSAQDHPLDYLANLIFECATAAFLGSRERMPKRSEMAEKYQAVSKAAADLSKALKDTNLGKQPVESIFPVDLFAEMNKELEKRAGMEIYVPLKNQSLKLPTDHTFRRIFGTILRSTPTTSELITRIGELADEKVEEIKDMSLILPNPGARSAPRNFVIRYCGMWFMAWFGKYLRRTLANFSGVVLDEPVSVDQVNDALRGWTPPPRPWKYYYGI